MRTLAISLGSLLVLLSVAGGSIAALAGANDFDFAILGDRTGEAVEGVYEQAWRETNLDHPAFVVTVGDTIQGGDERTMETEWEEAEAHMAPYRRFYKILLAPGNHDVWSPASANAYVAHSKRPLHYGFDFQQVHITVLDNSRTDDFSPEEMSFLKQDLAAHEKQPVKFVVSHRPSWILQAVLGSPAFPLHQLATHYGVKYVIAGHIHQMLHFEIDGVTYLSMASSGGHLREDKSYERGWFFQHTLVHVKGDKVSFEIKELQKPFGKGRVTAPGDWGAAGLIRR
jgi:3',5'-cyclic-AMP phosphodiesterase